MGIEKMSFVICHWSFAGTFWQEWKVEDMGAPQLAKKSFKSLRVYQLSEKLSDAIWDATSKWGRLERDTVGKQLIRSADSVGANIAEGVGRGSYQDNRRFVRNARKSLYETHHWLRRAHRRRLLSDQSVKIIKPLIDELEPRLNAYLRSIGPVPAQTLPEIPESGGK